MFITIQHSRTKYTGRCDSYLAMGKVYKLKRCALTMLTRCRGIGVFQARRETGDGVLPEGSIGNTQTIELPGLPAVSG